MPKNIIHAEKGVFNLDARRAVTAALIELALDCEKLPQSPFVKSTVWTYFNDYAADTIFMGSEPAWLNAVSVQIYTIEGGLDAGGKHRLIEGATQILARHCQSDSRVMPVYVALHEIPEANWGIFGQKGDLAALRSSAPDAPAL